MCTDEKTLLRLQVQFRVAKETKFDDAVECQKIARSSSFREVTSRLPDVLESQIGGQGASDGMSPFVITRKREFRVRSKASMAYFKHAEHMDVVDGMALVPGDKTKHAHWITSVETYEALLATYCCTSEYRSFSNMSKGDASSVCGRNRE